MSGTGRNVMDKKQTKKIQDMPEAEEMDRLIEEGGTILSPFMGIGSEGNEALRLNRKFVGVELKNSYFRQAEKNLLRMWESKNQLKLF
jgi:DNA modification methylase